MRRLIFGVAVGLSLPAAAQQPRDLSGTWALVPSAAQAARAAQDPPRDTTRPAPAPALERRRDDDRRGRQFGLLLGMAGAVPSFALDQTDSTLIVTNEDGFRYVLRVGGEGRLSLMDSLEVRHRAWWDGNTLEVEWRPDGGGSIIERYQLADSGLYLRVDVTVAHESFRHWDSRLYRRQ